MQDWEVKFKSLFKNAVVDKALMQKFESFKLPRFVSEYIVQQFIDEHGFENGVIKIEEFLNKHYPKSTATDYLHYIIQEEGEINIIDNFNKTIDQKLNTIKFNDNIFDNFNEFRDNMTNINNKIDDIKNYVIEKYPNHSEYLAIYILRYKAIEWNNMSLLDGSYIYKLLSCH
jgi:predicted ATP-dependent Lon-type protease